MAETGEIIARHRKEQKDLQGKIQALKKTMKADKKKKKEMLEEIARMEEELEMKHALELQQVQGTEYQIDTLAESIEAITTNASEEIAPRLSKAQKRREKKILLEKERQILIDAQEKENVHGARHVETRKIQSVLKKRNLMIHEIPSDGNCLYCAIDHQLKITSNGEMGIEVLRQLTSEFLMQHSTDFLPFLSDSDSGNILSSEQYEEYCYKIANTSAWGGEVELRALSHILKQPIEIIQAAGPTMVIGDEYKKEKPLTLTYHRHMYGLGEHYNSVKTYEETDEDSV